MYLAKLKHQTHGKGYGKRTPKGKSKRTVGLNEG